MNWVKIAQDQSTGIELVNAHFKGFAYDPHLHSSYLIGVTELGLQQFNCRRKVVNSYQGQVFMLEPDEPYRVCRRVNILRDYPDDKIKIYP